MKMKVAMAVAMKVRRKNKIANELVAQKTLPFVFFQKTATDQGTLKASGVGAHARNEGLPASTDAAGHCALNRLCVLLTSWCSHGHLTP